MPQAAHIAAPTSNAEYEALRNQAHEAYRGGDFHRALQLCQSVSTEHESANAPARCSAAVNERPMQPYHSTAQLLVVVPLNLSADNTSYPECSLQQQTAVFSYEILLDT